MIFGVDFAEELCYNYPCHCEGVVLMKRRVLTFVLVVVMLASMVVMPVSASAASKVQILRVTVDRARLRSGPSTAYEKITSLSKGSKVFYLKKMKDSFAYVCTGSGLKGYVYRGYLERYGVVYTYQVYRCNKSTAFVYKKNSTSSSKVTRLTKNQHVVVYQVQGSWAYIRTLGGKAGYVKKSALTKAS